MASYEFLHVLDTLLNILEMKTPPKVMGIGHWQSLVGGPSPPLFPWPVLGVTHLGISAYPWIDFLYVSEDAF